MNRDSSDSVHNVWKEFGEFEQQEMNMAMVTLGDNQSRFSGDAGIAIGPILFIIAILGILAAAIASGSGSFSSSTTRESNSARASALLEIGQNLKFGVDRVLTYGNNYIVTDVVIDPAQTSNEVDLFAPTGGGITPPSLSMRITNPDTTNDVWHYPMLKITNIGQRGSRVAMLRVDPGVCDQVNSKANSIPVTDTPGGTTATVPDLGGNIGTYNTTHGATDGTGTVADPFTNQNIILNAEDGTAVGWPPLQAGMTVGCVNYAGSAAAPAGYYYYQVLGTI